jgi:hypothetical protein
MHLLLDADQNDAGGYGKMSWRRMPDFPLGTLFDGGHHQIAMLSTLFGAPQWVFASGVSLRPEFGEFDHVLMQFGYAGHLRGCAYPVDSARSSPSGFRRWQSAQSSRGVLCSAPILASPSLARSRQGRTRHLLGDLAGCPQADPPLPCAWAGEANFPLHLAVCLGLGEAVHQRLDPGEPERLGGADLEPPAAGGGVRRGQPKGSYPQTRSAWVMAPTAANVCRNWRRAVQSGSFLRALPPAAGVAARCPGVEKPAAAPWVEKPGGDWTPTAPGANAGQGSVP